MHVSIALKANDGTDEDVLIPAVPPRGGHGEGLRVGVETDAPAR